jgi:HPt (histidine-containing phosphotransfer) domain-containing protein
MLAEMLRVCNKKKMIDLSYFIQLSNNKPSFLLKVMDIFINETPKDLAELEKNYAEVNYKKVKEICHKLKSLFKSYNMKELSALTMELESHAKKEVFSEETTGLLRQVQEIYLAHRVEMIEHMTKYKT